jgi:hypothetical protein
LKILGRAFAAGVLEFFVTAASEDMGMEDGKVENKC